MPPLWSLGYQQSHRTLASREVVMSVARTFREKKLPCDTLIYLGTGFCPSGWNTGHGSFEFNPPRLPRPQADARRAAQDALSRCAARGDPRAFGARAVRAIDSTRAAPTSRRREATGMHIGAFSRRASTVGGPTRATRSMVHPGWRESGCTTKDARSTAPTSALMPSIATALPACSATRRSSGRVTFIRPGRP